MSKLQKAKERLRKMPKDYTYSEARTLLRCLGYEESSKGKTSGSRAGFYRRKDQSVILLHKPHPGDIMKEGAVKQLRSYLMEKGEI